MALTSRMRPPSLFHQIRQKSWPISICFWNSAQPSECSLDVCSNSNPCRLSSKIIVSTEDPAGNSFRNRCSRTRVASSKLPGSPRAISGGRTNPSVRKTKEMMYTAAMNRSSPNKARLAILRNCGTWNYLSTKSVVAKTWFSSLRLSMTLTFFVRRNGANTFPKCRNRVMPRRANASSWHPERGIPAVALFVNALLAALDTRNALTGARV